MNMVDTVLRMFSKKSNQEQNISRSEREARIKDKAGLVINLFAALLAFNTYVGGSLSSTILNNTIKANDMWNFYQAKSMKQTMYELAALDTTDPKLQKTWLAKAESYESDPVTQEGKREIMAAAKKLEADRDHAKKRSPWISYAGTAYQLSIVVLSASILAVSMPLFWTSFAVATTGVVLMSQGLWLWF